MSDQLDLPIDSLRPMSTRLYNALTDPVRGNGFKTVRELVGWTRRAIKRTPQMGEQTLAELDGILAARGLEYAAEVDRQGNVPLPFPDLHARLSRIEQTINSIQQRLDQIEATLRDRMLHPLLREVGDMGAFQPK